MLKCKSDLFALPRKVGVAVAECVEVGAPPESLTWLGPLLFSRVMDENDRQIERSLELAEVAQESRDI